MEPNITSTRPKANASVSREGLRPKILPPDHPERPALQHFIADTYSRSYGANIQHFAQQLLALRDPRGDWSAAVGYTLAGQEPLFLEQYLDNPVETEISKRLATPIRREQIVEVGNLAASTAGAARRLIVCATSRLYELGRTWVVFTATRSLLNSFGRLGIAPIVLAQADPLRLADGGSNWGTYYATRPQVMTANIPLGFVHFAREHALLPT